MLLRYDSSELTFLLLPLDGDLLSNFFLDLVKGLKEELFDLRSLIQHHLSKGSHILQLFVLALQGLLELGDVFPLLLDDLFVLEFEELLLLFEIVDDLLEGLLQDEDLFFQDLDFLLLLDASLLVLV